MQSVYRLAAVAACALAAASAVQAQVRLIAPAANVTPSASALAAQAAPNPAGLQSPFPAGVNSGSGAAVSNDPIAASAAAVPPTSVVGAPGPVIVPGVVVRPGGLAPGFNGVPVPATNVLGAGATLPGPPQRLQGGAGGFSATDVARSFFFADANKDGELTPAEAARLSIVTLSFTEMDRNFDGVITRFEYEDSLR